MWADCEAPVMVVQLEACMCGHDRGPAVSFLTRLMASLDLHHITCSSTDLCHSRRLNITENDAVNTPYHSQPAQISIVDFQPIYLTVTLDPLQCLASYYSLIVRDPALCCLQLNSCKITLRP